MVKSYEILWNTAATPPRQIPSSIVNATRPCTPGEEVGEK